MIYIYIYIYIYIADADFGGAPLDAAPCELAEGVRLEVADSHVLVFASRPTGVAMMHLSATGTARLILSRRVFVPMLSQ